MFFQREYFNCSSQQKLFPKFLTAHVLENTAKGQFSKNMSASNIMRITSRMENKA